MAAEAELAPMELPEILEAVRGGLLRYVVFTKEAYATAIALWVAHTWVIDAFDYTPYLHISSPVKRCGKSRVFDCLRLLCAKSWPVLCPSEAVLFRKIEKDTPTLLLDEIDALFSAKGSDENKEAFRAVLNVGFESVVLRKPGNTRGCRLISADSVRTYLCKLLAEQEAEP